MPSFMDGMGSGGDVGQGWAQEHPTPSSLGARPVWCCGQKWVHCKCMGWLGKPSAGEFHWEHSPGQACLAFVK